MSSAGTNPVAEGAAASDAPEVNESDRDVVQDQDREGLEDADDGEQSEVVDDTDEIDLDGKKYRIPKAAKAGFMMHSDYTKKTKELAEQRKQFEASRGTAVNADKTYIEAMAEKHAVGKELATYKDVDWDTLQANNPEAYDAHWRKFTRLQHDAQAADTKITDAVQSRALETQNTRSKQIEEAAAQLPQLIPDWSDELSEKIAKYGTEEGYSRAELAESTIQNPRIAATLNKARLWDEHVKSQKVAKRAAVQEEARPVAEVGSKAPAAKNPDRMSTAEWMAHEAARVAAKNKRVGR